MRLAIFGATGAVGSTLLVHLLKGNDLLPGDEVVLVGRGTSASLWKLKAIRADLLDAFDAGIITVSVCWSLEELDNPDVFVMAAGATISEGITQRVQLAKKNLPLFTSVAKTLSERCRDTFVILISNPNELAVAAFSLHLHRRKVLGIGAQQDSIRFSRAIAKELGLPREAVRASVLGEHGEGMVPLWSSACLVEGTAEMNAELLGLRERCVEKSSRSELPRLHAELQGFIQRSELDRAFSFVGDLGPDQRIQLEPQLTVNLLRSTPNATANAALDCIAAIRHADGRKIHGQVLLNGEFYGIKGVVGAPLTLRRSEWTIANHSTLTDGELHQLLASADRTKDLYNEMLLQHIEQEAVEDVVV